MYSEIMSPLPLARWYIAQVVKNGDTVIDCTAGRGRDTIFLASLVGPQGKVFAFDVQKEAISATSERLIANGLESRVRCKLASHAHIDLYIEENVRIKAAMYNLGYLPGGNHQITTKSGTTLESLQKVLCLLCPGGIVTLVSYSGHCEGLDEDRKLLDFTGSLDKKVYGVMAANFWKETEYPPKLYVIEKAATSKYVEVQE